LGLQADIAMSLNNASTFYRAMAEAEEETSKQIELLRKALSDVEEAVDTFRVQGIVLYLIVGLLNNVTYHLILAERTGSIDHDRVLALCDEGETLCAQMGDDQRKAFFNELINTLEQLHQPKPGDV